MFTLTKEDMPRFALLLPLLVVLALLFFAVTAQAQTRVVPETTKQETSVNDLIKLKLDLTQLINELNRFNQEEVEPASNKAIAAQTVLEKKQEILSKAADELKKMQENYLASKKKLEGKTGCILKEDTMTLDCTKEDK